MEGEVRIYGNVYHRFGSVSWDEICNCWLVLLELDAGGHAGEAKQPTQWVDGQRRLEKDVIVFGDDHIVQQRKTSEILRAFLYQPSFEVRKEKHMS